MQKLKHDLNPQLTVKGIIAQNIGLWIEILIIILTFVLESAP
jgi:hypothetical protein